MAIKNQAAEPALRSVLGAGERLFAAAPLLEQPMSDRNLPDGDESTNSLGPALLLALGRRPADPAGHAVFGRGVIGTPGSIARELFDLVGRVPEPRLVITDRRLLVVDVAARSGAAGRWRRLFRPPAGVATQLHSVPRAAILGAVPAPAGPPAAGRFLLGFVDGSGCVLGCASPSVAESVIRAVGPPRPDDTDEVNP